MTHPIEPRLSSPEAPRTILVIEDEGPPIIEELLRGLGYSDIRRAYSIPSALSSISLARPHLAILAASVNGATAYRVAQRLTDAGIPFVIAGALSPAQLPPEFQSGVPLTKPYTAAGMAEAVRVALGRHGQAANFPTPLAGSAEPG